MSEAADKICFFCGESCVGLPRGKDPSGNYYHTECMERANTTKAAEAMVPTFDSADDSGFAMLGADGDDDLDAIGMMADLVSDGEAGAAAGEGGRTRCPNCKSDMEVGAVVCLMCGYNMQTGEVLQAETKKVKGGAGEGATAAMGLLSNPWIVFLLVSVVFVALFFGLRGVEGGFFAYYGIASLFYTVMYIWVVVLAFMDGIGHGIGSLICGIYNLFYGLLRAKATLVRALYGASLIGYLVMLFGIQDVMDLINEFQQEGFQTTIQAESP